MRLIKFIQKMKLAFTITALLFALSACVNVLPQDVNVSRQDWKEEFNIADRKLVDTGESKYFILSPGFQTITIFALYDNSVAYCVRQSLPYNM